MSPATALPGDTDKHRFVREMFDRIAPRYDLVNSVMTFGLDRRWRRLTVQALSLALGSRVLDLACGPGEICAVLRVEGYLPVGMDLSWGMLAAGSENDGPGGAHVDAPRRGFARVQGDAAALPIADCSFDGITCGFGLRNFADLPMFFSEAHRVLRPGGRLAVLEVSVPRNWVLKAGHRAYFHHLVPRIGSLLSDGPAYRYLPESVTYLPDGQEMAERLCRVGFESIAMRQLAGGATQLVTATRS